MTKKERKELRILNENLTYLNEMGLRRLVKIMGIELDSLTAKLRSLKPSKKETMLARQGTK